MLKHVGVGGVREIESEGIVIFMHTGATKSVDLAGESVGVIRLSR
jgi:hypothetical protein